MDLTTAIQNRIRQLCAERNITINKLSTICGITQSTLNNIFTRPNNKPTVSTIKKICDGLNITLVEFFNSDIFYELEQEIK
ncbi:MAG: helix-turn-helix transcriptional regulator [Oscillospiraceae bacterium]|nr:helix-turn-helix transcriptional regulator [Oscillospiraceae bacterium]